MGFMTIDGRKVEFTDEKNVLSVIRNLSTLERLDVSFNNGGDETFLALKILAQELEGLRLLSFDK